MSGNYKKKTQAVVIGSDHGGFRLKEKIKKFLGDKGYQVKDVGCFNQESCDYPVYAYEAAKEVSLRNFSKGILICKSGIGNSMVANKLPGVRAALCYNLKAAKLSRMHNDANVLVLGALFVNEAMAKRMVSLWLKTEFEGGRHLRRVEQIKKIEDKTNELFKKNRPADI